MKLDRSKIGLTLPLLHYDVERCQLRFFSKTVGETDPIYFDEEVARRAGYRSIIAPPSFGFSCLRGSAEQMPFVTAMGLSEDQVARSLHGEQSFSYGEPICAGDRITIEENILDIYERRNGTMQFLVTLTRLTNQLGQRVGEMSSTLIIRTREGARP
ncbi:acyl dehydratase [Rhodoligotrophos appendicifer]|uniref:MaoC family dehydratase N-terminal domain-containing protein n=1 Tax=Rhodoligotrophos appendicifer TaxID=987056 RepID=UPI0014782DB0|nr:MaoC family dehydratase N-terminal domain-containing protein [Rhodoligotrophos appendicifer]